jgi:uncharacterized protein (TIGR00369 family)
MSTSGLSNALIAPVAGSVIGRPILPTAPDDLGPRSGEHPLSVLVPLAGGPDEEVGALVLSAPCANLLGRRLLGHDKDRGWIKFGFEGKPDFLNPAGRVQGSLLTAMLDDTMGPVVLLKSGGALYPSSIDMNVTFLAAAKPGPLVCEGEVLRLGKTVGFVEGRLMDSDGRLIARATSSVMLVPAERVG